jgi:tetratricopeptide (TPR) repeat protein
VVNRPWAPNWTTSNSIWNSRYQSNYYRPNYIHPNFTRSVNYAYCPDAWGSRPWWSSGHSHSSWHYGNWNYGWNNRWNSRYHYYCEPVAYYPPGYRPYSYGASSIIPWGLAAWSLGNVAYDTGYYRYSNPYYAPPVQTRTTVINYTSPISVAAVEYVPVSEEEALTSAEKSSAALERSRASFRQADYLAALKEVDEAISYEPGDSALHEYRALTLFALGRYGDAAGVLNPVLASGPGWDWDTMIDLYDSPERYTEQFRKLEDYVVRQPDSAGGHFLLGYHYLVGTHLEEAYAMFDRASELQPADTVSRQLRSLVADSIPTDEISPEPADGSGMVAEEKVIIGEEALYGIWTAPSADGKMITLSLTDLGTFSWNFEGAKEGEVLSGDWSIDDDGFLVLVDEDVQLVGDITLKDDNTMHFLLAGSPEGDPGLTFVRN